MGREKRRSRTVVEEEESAEDETLKARASTSCHERKGEGHALPRIDARLTRAALSGGRRRRVRVSDAEIGANRDKRISTRPTPAGIAIPHRARVEHDAQKNPHEWINARRWFWQQSSTRTRWQMQCPTMCIPTWPTLRLCDRPSRRHSPRCLAPARYIQDKRDWQHTGCSARSIFAMNCCDAFSYRSNAI